MPKAPALGHLATSVAFQPAIHSLHRLDRRPPESSLDLKYASAVMQAEKGLPAGLTVSGGRTTADGNLCAITVTRASERAGIPRFSDEPVTA